MMYNLRRQRVFYNALFQTHFSSPSSSLFFSPFDSLHPAVKEAKRAHHRYAMCEWRETFLSLSLSLSPALHTNGKSSGKLKRQVKRRKTGEHHARHVGLGASKCTHFAFTFFALKTIASLSLLVVYRKPTLPCSLSFFLSLRASRKFFNFCWLFSFKRTTHKFNTWRCCVFSSA